MKEDRERKIENNKEYKKETSFRRNINKLIFIRNFILLIIAAVLTVITINRTGAYPWGSDTYGHLFKGNILYDSIKRGDLFLNYHESWYNGIQPFRYWAPLPYYVLALINFTTKNIFLTYNVFIVFVFILGGVGWLGWGHCTNRQNLGIILAILWFFVPNNLRILFSEGNIPYVIVNSLIPLILLYYYKSVQQNKVMNSIILSILMCMATLTHAMLSAMTGLSLFILAFCDSMVNKRYLNNLLALIYAFIGIMLSSFWLIPALKGGIISIDKSAVAAVMKELTYPLSISLNPLLRFKNIEIYYYGITFALVGIFGMLMSTRRELPSFLSALVILAGTTKVLLPLLQKLPMNQMFWMSRFTSISMAMIIMSIILWKRLRKGVLVFIITILIVDSGASFYVLGFNGQFPYNMSQNIDLAAKIATQRIGVLDNSYFGSFPSYYIAYNSVHGATNQVFGWAWQGAATAKNIVSVNTALERGYYGLMFDRCLELGADTLLVKKSLVKDMSELEKYSSVVGFKKYIETNEAIIYKYPAKDCFGTTVNYEGIAIGSFAPNVVYIFPKFQVGEKSFVEDYTFDELKSKKVIFLSGFKYKDKKLAEELLLKLSKNGVKVVIDATGLEEKFLGVTAEPITINKNYGNLYYKNEKLDTRDFPYEERKWKTSFLSGIDNKESYEVAGNKLLSFVGNKDNRNLNFIGLNIPYFSFLTKDEKAIGILEDLFSMKAYELPDRQIHKVIIERKNNKIYIYGDSTKIVVPIAALDAFVSTKGSYKNVNNLIYLDTSDIEIEIIYPYIKKGILVSIGSLLIIIGISVFLTKRYKHEEAMNVSNRIKGEKRRDHRVKRFKKNTRE